MPRRSWTLKLIDFLVAFPPASVMCWSSDYISSEPEIAPKKISSRFNGINIILRLIAIEQISFRFPLHPECRSNEILATNRYWNYCWNESNILRALSIESQFINRVEWVIRHSEWNRFPSHRCAFKGGSFKSAACLVEILSTGESICRVLDSKW